MNTDILIKQEQVKGLVQGLGLAESNAALALNAEIISGYTTEVSTGTSSVQPVINLIKNSGLSVNIDMSQLLSLFLNKQSTSASGTLAIDADDSDNGISIEDVFSDENITSTLKLSHDLSDPVRLSISGEHSTNSLDSVRLVIVNKSSVKRAYLLKDKALPTLVGDILASEELLNSGEITTLINAAIAGVGGGGLSIPTKLDLESNLPTSGNNDGDYYFIEDMDVTAPGKSGRAWFGSGAFTVMVDSINTMSSVFFTQNISGEWILTPDIAMLIDNSLQRTQLKSTEPDGSSTNNEITSARRLYEMLGDTVNHLSTHDKHIIPAINEVRLMAEDALDEAVHGVTTPPVSPSQEPLVWQDWTTLPPPPPPLPTPCPTPLYGIVPPPPTLSCMLILCLNPSSGEIEYYYGFTQLQMNMLGNADPTWHIQDNPTSTTVLLLRANIRAVFFNESNLNTMPTLGLMFTMPDLLFYNHATFNNPIKIPNWFNGNTNRMLHGANLFQSELDLSLSSFTNLNNLGEGWRLEVNFPIKFPATVTNIVNTFLDSKPYFNQTLDFSACTLLLTIPRFYNNISFNCNIIFPPNLTTLPLDFLSNNNSFNQPFDLSQQSNLTTINAQCLDHCIAFNAPVYFPTNQALNIVIGANFMRDCWSFNSGIFPPENIDTPNRKFNIDYNTWRINNYLYKQYEPRYPCKNGYIAPPAPADFGLAWGMVYWGTLDAYQPAWFHTQLQLNLLGQSLLTLMALLNQGNTLLISVTPLQVRGIYFSEDNFPLTGTIPNLADQRAFTLFDQPLVLPTKLKTIGLILYQNTGYYQDVTFPTDLETSPGQWFEHPTVNLGVYNRPIDLSACTNLTNIGTNILINNRLFNHRFTFPLAPANRITITNGFLSGNLYFDKVIENFNDTTILSVGATFMLNNIRFNSELHLPNVTGAQCLDGCFLFNNIITLSEEQIQMPLQFMRYCYSFNQPITIPQKVTLDGTILADFMRDCISFNQPIVLDGGDPVNSTTLKSIGANFMWGCSRFNTIFDLPDSITTIGLNAFQSWLSFNQPWRFPKYCTVLNTMCINWTLFNSEITWPQVVSSMTGIFSYAMSYNKPINFPIGTTVPLLVSTYSSVFQNCINFNSELIFPGPYNLNSRSFDNAVSYHRPFYVDFNTRLCDCFCGADTFAKSGVIVILPNAISSQTSFTSGSFGYDIARNPLGAAYTKYIRLLNQSLTETYLTWAAKFPDYLTTWTRYVRE